MPKVKKPKKATKVLTASEVKIADPVVAARLRELHLRAQAMNCGMAHLAAEAQAAKRLLWDTIQEALPGLAWSTRHYTYNVLTGTVTDIGPKPESTPF